MQSDEHVKDIVLESLSSLLDRDGARGAHFHACHAYDAIVGAGWLSPGTASYLDEVVDLDGTCLDTQSVSFTYIVVDENIGQLREPSRSAHRVFY